MKGKISWGSLLRRAPVIVEQLGPRRQRLLRHDGHAVVPAHHHNPREAVWVVRVVGELELVPLHLGVEHPLLVEVEEEGTVDAVVDLPAAVGLALLKRQSRRRGDEQSQASDTHASKLLGDSEHLRRAHNAGGKSTTRVVMIYDDRITRA